MPLPVNPTQVDRQNYVQINRVGEHPPLPQVQVGQRTQQFLPIVLSRFAIEAQQNATRNFLRTFYFNLVSANYWHNEYCANALKTTLDIVEYALWTSQGDPQQIIASAVADATEMLVAYFANAYAQQGLSQYIDGNAWQAVNAALARLNQYQQGIAQLSQQLMAQQPQMGYGQPVGMGGYYPNAMPVQNRPFNTNQLPVGHMSGPQMTPFAPPTQLSGLPRRGEMSSTPEPQQPGFQQQPFVAPVQEFRRGIPRGELNAETLQVNEVRGGPQQPMEVRTAPAAPPAPAPVVVTPPESKHTFTRLDTPTAAPRRPVTVIDPTVYGTPEPAPAAPVETVTPPVADTVLPKRNEDFTVTYPEDPYKEIVMSDGTICRRAVDSGWTPTRTTAAPYPMAYNPATQLLVYVRTPDGIIRQMLRELTDEAAPVETYLDHELDPQLRQLERERLAADRPRSVIDWSRITRLQIEPEKPYGLEAVPEPEPVVAEGEEDGEAVAMETTPQRVERVLACDDPKSLMALAVTEYPELSEVILTHPVELYGMRMESRLTRSDIEGIIEELGRAKTFQGAKTHLETLIREKPQDQEIWTLIDERLTENVNHYLNTSLSIPWKIGSFLEDIGTLEDEVRGDYGDVPATLLATLAPLILCVSCDLLPREVGDDESPGDVVSLTLVNRYSVTCIPEAFADLSVAFSGMGAVSKSALPELYAFLDGILDRTEDYPNPFYARYIRTSDNHWLRLDGAMLADDTYLLSEFK